MSPSKNGGKKRKREEEGKEENKNKGKKQHVTERYLITKYM